MCQSGVDANTWPGVNCIASEINHRIDVDVVLTY